MSHLLTWRRRGFTLGSSHVVHLYLVSDKKKISGPETELGSNVCSDVIFSSCFFFTFLTSCDSSDSGVSVRLGLDLGGSVVVQHVGSLCSLMCAAACFCRVHRSAGVCVCVCVCMYTNRNVWLHSVMLSTAAPGGHCAPCWQDADITSGF